MVRELGRVQDVGGLYSGLASVAGRPGLVRSHSSQGSTRSLPVVSTLGSAPSLSGHAASWADGQVEGA